MRRILEILKRDGSIKIGEYALYYHSAPPVIWCRHPQSLISGDERATVSGLRRLLAWIDEPHTKDELPAQAKLC